MGAVISPSYVSQCWDSLLSEGMKPSMSQGGGKTLIQVSVSGTSASTVCLFVFYFIIKKLYMQIANESPCAFFCFQLCSRLLFIQFGSISAHVSRPHIGWALRQESWCCPG